MHPTSGRMAWILAPALFVVAILALAFLWLRIGEDENPGVGPREARQAVDGERGPAGLSGPEHAAEPALERVGVAAPGEPASSKPREPRAAAAEDPAPGRPELPELLVRAIDRATGVPVAGLLVGLHRVVSEVAQRQLKPWTRGLRTSALVPVTVRTTGPDGRAGFTPAPGVPLRVVTLGEYAGDPLAERVLAEGDVGELDRERWPVRFDLPPLAAGEVRAFDFVTPVRRRARLRLRVLAGTNPVAGAKVMLVRRRATAIAGTGSVERAGSTECGTTDAAGRIEVEATMLEDVHGRVEADGFGPAFFVLVETRRELVVRLRRSASVSGRLVDTDGAAASGVRIQARANMRNHAWFGGVPASADQGGDLEWGARTDTDGRFVLEGLPAGVAIELYLMNEDRALCDADWPLVLEPGEEREVLWTACEGWTLEGVVLDREGQPLPERAVWLLRGEGVPEGRRYLRGNELETDQVIAATLSDLDGRFTLDELVAGNYWIALAPREHPGPSAALPVRVSAQTQVVVRELPSLRIRGLVLRRGVACAGALVRATPEPGLGEVIVLADATGAFDLGPVAAGTFLLRAEMDGTVGVPVRAEAGDVALELLVE